MFEAFHNRLKKQYKHLGKWARKNGITCYRIYEKDLPEFPVSIDWYEGRLYICNIAPFRKEESRFTDKWLEEVAEEAKRTLGAQEVYLRRREKQSQENQYEKLDTSGNFFTVKEQGLTFRINLTDYLDTGLFLDHRNARDFVRTNASGKRVLNLFSYTCSFSVYAATGGASKVTSVDLSNTYLEWGKENFKLNGLNPDNYKFVRTDVLQFIKKLKENTFDIIVLDPPTFSNSSKMLDTLDVQRDHYDMITTLMKALSKDGFLLFSTNNRKFKLNSDLKRQFRVDNFTEYSLPADFRNQKIHQSYLISKL